MLRYSNTELQYLRESLTSVPPVRPDARGAGQFRPVESEIDLLPATYGSARVKATDGSECIVGIKAKVKSEWAAGLVEVSVDITGFKDNDNFPNSMAVVLKQVLEACPELKSRLQLSPHYAYRLFVDCVVLSYSSNPLSLLSIAVFQALKATRLPRPVDAAMEEADIPQFHDDWSLADPLCPTGWTPPLLLNVALVGSTVLVDPTLAEEQVAEASMCITWKNGGVAAPIRTIDKGSDANVGFFSSKLVLDAYDLIVECAPSIVSSLS